MIKNVYKYSLFKITILINKQLISYVFFFFFLVSRINKQSSSKNLWFSYKFIFVSIQSVYLYNFYSFYWYILQTISV